mgnify:CR=1 FL=1
MVEFSPKRAIMTPNFRGWRGLNVDQAVARFKELHGHPPTLILAREGAALTGDTGMVRRSRIPNVNLLLMTDEIKEWNGK